MFEEAQQVVPKASVDQLSAAPEKITLPETSETVDLKMILARLEKLAQILKNHLPD